MNKIKTIIIASFILVIVSASIGVAIYYSYLSPFRVLAKEQGLEGILSKITYLKYNATDQDGNNYLIELVNNPQEKSGRADLYENGKLLYTFYYNYTATGLTSAKIVYSNGSIRTFNGAEVVLVEDYFFSSLQFSYNSQNKTVNLFKPFPGVAPVYLPIFLKDRAQVDWGQLSHITRRGEPSQIMEARIGSGSAKFMGKTVKGATILLTPRVINPPNDWTRLTYSLFITKYNGIAVLPAWSVGLTVPGKQYQIEYALISVKHS